MSDFVKIDSKPSVPEESYATDMLERIDSNNRWLRMNRGNHGVVSFRSQSNAADAHLHERPFVSVTGWSSVLQIPWYVGRGLRRLTLRAFVRLGAGNDTGESVPDTGWAGYLRARLLGREPSDAVAVQPVRVTPSGFSRFGWQYVEWTYDLGEGVDGVFDILSLEIKTEIPNRSLSAADIGIIATTPINTDFSTRRQDRVWVTADMYDQGVAVNAPTGNTGESTASLLVAFDDKILGMVDHVAAGTNKRQMYIWPPTADAESEAMKVKLSYASWFQFRTFEVEEEYAADSTATTLYQSQRPPASDMALTLAEDLQGLCRRKMLLGADHAGYYTPELSTTPNIWNDAAWNDRKYMRLHPAVFGGKGSHVASIAVIPARVPRTADVALSMIGYYRSLYQEAEVAQETMDKGVTGYVVVSVSLKQGASLHDFADRYEPLTYTLINRMGAHYLRMLSFENLDTTANKSTVLLAREGMVLEEDFPLLEQLTCSYDISSLRDFFDWTQPVEVLVEVNVHHGLYGGPPALSDYPHWLGEPVEPSEPGHAGRPARSLMAAKITGCTVWGAE